MEITESTNKNYSMPRDPLLTPEQLRIAGNPKFYIGGTMTVGKTGCLVVSGLCKIGTKSYVGGALRVNLPKKKKISSCTERNYMK